MNLNTGLLGLVIVLLLVLLARPQAGRYQPVDGSHGAVTVDTATGHLCSLGKCQ